MVTGFDLRARRHKMESQNPAIVAKNNKTLQKNKNRLFFFQLSTIHKTTICGQDSSFYPVKIRCTLGISLPVPCVCWQTFCTFVQSLSSPTFAVFYFWQVPFTSLYTLLNPWYSALTCQPHPLVPGSRPGL